MWPVLFAPVPEVFRHPFQAAPLDLGTSAFLPARRAAVQARLEAIQGGGAPAMLREVWGSQYGRRCVGVRWESYRLDDLLEICT